MKLSQALTSSEEIYAAQPSEIQDLTREQLDNVVVSYAKLEGQIIPLGLYRDDVWLLAGNTTNRAKSNCKLRFKRIPESYRDIVKAMAWRYQMRGSNGGVRPKISSMVGWFSGTIQFTNWLDDHKIPSLNAVTPMVCMAYVQKCKAKLSKRGKPLTPTSLRLLFEAVEAIYEFSQYTVDPMPHHPWSESSARYLAGALKGGMATSSKTPLMPDSVFCTLFQEAWKRIQSGSWLLDLRDGINQIEIDSAHLNYTAIKDLKNHFLNQAGFNGLVRQFNQELIVLRTAAYIILASLSGCRNHELAAIRSGSCYSTVDDSGETYWWMKSRSNKTCDGYTEWMIPEATVTAIEIMERWARPYQEEIEREIMQRNASNPLDPEIAEAQKHRQAIFLGKNTNHFPYVRTLSIAGWRDALKDFCKIVGLAWDLATHQFRRKFANYVAHSQFGDLRYLKDHFKHWSMDMTLVYALNGSQEMELYLEIQDELDAIKLGVVGNWLKPDEPLAGGLGMKIVAWRGSNSVTLFKDHASMVHSLAESVPIRSNLHSWCTADYGDCVGREMADSLRCTGCEHSAIGKKHAYIYQRQLNELQVLLDCKDIGETGLTRIQHNIDRCRTTLEMLGIQPELPVNI